MNVELMQQSRRRRHRSGRGSAWQSGRYLIPTAKQDRAITGAIIIEPLMRPTAYGWNLSGLLAKVRHHNIGKKE